MRVLKNTKFWDVVRGARNAETEILHDCTARLRLPRNEVTYPKVGFERILN